MTPEPEFLLKSTRILIPEGEIAGAVHIQGGKILAVLSDGSPLPNLPIEDAGNDVVMPGLVDSHVHINEPGRTEWEGFETATRAAAAGGITSLVDMPLNCIPVTTTLSALETKLSATRDKLWVDCGFYGGLIPGNTPDLEPMIHAGVLGFKCFLVHSGIDDFPNATEVDLRAGMPILAQYGVPLLVHAELDLPGQSEDLAADPALYQTYLDSRPPEMEMNAIRLMIELARETRCHVHIVHLSCSDAVPMIEVARQEGVPITVETCPHYLALTAEEIANGDTRFKCAPPIREAENRQKLWQGLEAKTIDFIISDHSPCEPVLKKLDLGHFMDAWGGISSLQFGLSIIWTEALARGYSLQSLVQWMCEGPAKLTGLNNQKGAIAPGYDADFVVWDPEAGQVIHANQIQHRHKITPYEGKHLRGVVHQTYLRGRKIYDHSGFLSPPAGQHLLRPRTTPASSRISVQGATS